MHRVRQNSLLVFKQSFPDCMNVRRSSIFSISGIFESEFGDPELPERVRSLLLEMGAEGSNAANSSTRKRVGLHRCYHRFRDDDRTERAQTARPPPCPRRGLEQDEERERKRIRGRAADTSHQARIVRTRLVGFAVTASRQFFECEMYSPCPGRK